MTDKLDATTKEVWRAVNKAFRGALSLEKYYDKGSTARVFLVTQRVGRFAKGTTSPEVRRIVKVARHDSDDETLDAFSSIFENEIATLIEVVHTNVVGFLDAGTVQLRGQVVPFYVMEFLPGAEDFDDYIKARLAHGTLSKWKVYDLLAQVCEGLAALHARARVHGDLKFANVLVGGTADSSVAKITDFGFSKVIRRRGRALATGLYTTLDNLPSAYNKYVIRSENSKRAFVEIPRSRINPRFDLHYLGRFIAAALEFGGMSELLGASDTHYLAHLAARLNLDSGGDYVRYDHATQVLDDLRKLNRSYIHIAGIPELNRFSHDDVVRLPVSGNVPFTQRVRAVVGHPWFLRLRSAVQLGFVSLVYPGATHTRFEHSLGVYSNTLLYISALLADSHVPYFKQLFDEELWNTLIVAALVHDIGQHSFAHVLEDVQLSPRHERVFRALLLGENVNEYLPSHLAQEEPLSEVIRREWGLSSLDALLYLVTREPPAKPVPPQWRIAREVINGPIDADKTDYLLRDGHHCGVEYVRSIDLGRLLASLTTVLQSGRAGIGVTWKGIEPAENVKRARTAMFGVVYWHHAVRSANAMLARAVDTFWQTADDSERRQFTHVLYTEGPGGVLGYLRTRQGAPECSRLAVMLQRRQLFKRLRELSFERAEERGVYNELSELRITLAKSGDYSMRAFTTALAEELRKAKTPGGRISANDILVDVPPPQRDKLSPFCYYPKGQPIATDYLHTGAQDQYDNWEKEVRRLRVYVSPDVSWTGPWPERDKLLAAIGAALQTVRAGLERKEVSAEIDTERRALGGRRSRPARAAGRSEPQRRR